jgi:hypothetical protein
MKILVACEESQEVCKAFRAKGHEAYSCDIQECSGGHPEWHIMGDVLPLINGRCEFETMDGQKHKIDGKWDLLIAHPPCTYLTVAGNRWFNVGRYGEKAIERAKNREDAINFFFAFVNADCDYIAIENPVGVISTVYRKPDQIIQPYEYGHHARKKTCLWLKGLSLLQPTDVVDPGEILHGGYSVGAHADGRDANGKWLRFSDPEIAKLRSKTFPGIAKAMANQWAELQAESEDKE